MDALSNLLRVVRFSGGVFLEANFRAPWCVRAQVTPEDCGAGVRTDATLVAFHYVLDGRMQVRVGNGKLRTARPGEIILLSHNDPHLLGSDVTLNPMEAKPMVRQANAHELPRIDFGKGRLVKNRFVCGFLATPMRRNPLLMGLPKLLVANLRGRPCAEWAETSFRYAALSNGSDTQVGVSFENRSF
jgi:hypothetical protein